MHCKILILIFSLLGITGFSQVWVADKGDGTYKNPVLYANSVIVWMEKNSQTLVNHSKRNLVNGLAQKWVYLASAMTP